jgi:hypothetical protein
MVQEVCEDEPALREVGSGHFAACHFAEQVGEMARGAL